nr:MAG: polymerase PB1 [Xinjiang sediment orthomyxo-like virus 5]
MDIDPFDEIHNSFFDSCFNNGRNTLPSPDFQLMSTLSSISGLYLYVNPPPMGYGTPAPYVAETILRTRKYNRKQQNRTIKIDRFEIDNTVWDINEPFDLCEISSNWHPSHFHNMCKDYLTKHIDVIRNTSERIMENYLNTNSDVLTKGRQTWCPIMEKSVQSAVAMKNWCDLLINNGFPDHHSVVEIIKYTMDLMNLDELKTKEIVWTTITRRIRSRGQYEDVEKPVRYVKDIIIKGKENVRNKILDYLRSFCSYIKHNERSHLKRRAIASPSIPLRAMFLIVEEFHLAISKLTPGATISIGGDEKKRKIIQEMNSATSLHSNIYTIQATQDATKWNECLSPQLFGMLSETFFNDDIRRRNGLPTMTPNERLFGIICQSSHFILAIKRITLGVGLQGISSDYHGIIRFAENKLSFYNKKTQEWFKPLFPLDGIYINSSGGMLMGMHNGLSTTVGLVTVNYKIPNLQRICTLRSSDDAMTLYLANDYVETLELIKLETRNLKFAAINQSKEKTSFFNTCYGEYTSWYQDGKMVSQYGPETTKLRPGGKNPPDDFFNIAKGVSVSLMGCDTNIYGAEVSLRLGISNVRDLYRIKPIVTKSGVSNKVLVLSDGGLNPWSCMNSHLEETSLKMRYIDTENEREYMYKIRDPDNPFVGESMEEITWNKDTGSLSVTEIENPRTVFSTIRRSNRSIINSKEDKSAETEKFHAEALKIIHNTDLSTLLKTPGSSIKCSDHVKSALTLLCCDIEFSQEEKKLIDQAMLRLDGAVMDGEDEIEINEIYDFDTLYGE